jgi:hypothetical protein
MAPYYDGDDGYDDDDNSVGRRLLAPLRDRDLGGPDETAQAPPMTMGQYRGRPSTDDVGFKPRPTLLQQADQAVDQAKQNGNGSDSGPRRMQQPVSMVTPRPTLHERGPAASTGTDAATDITVSPGIAKRPTLQIPNVIQRPSMVSALPPAPSAPEADPRRAAAIDTISQASVPTAKVDAQGNTLPQYKMGLGRRILMGAAATLGHGLPGLAEVTSNPNDPNYIGSGAVNSRYTRDEAARQARLKGGTEQESALDKEAALQERDFQNKNTQYRDEAKTAAQQDVLAERTSKDQAIDAERAKTNQVRQQAEDLKKSMQAPTFNSQTGKFMAGDATIAPKNNDEGWSWEIANGLTTYDANGKLVKAGPYTRAAMSENKNNPNIHVHTGEGSKWSKVDEANIMAYARDHQIPGKTADEAVKNMSKQQFDEAQGRKPSGGETFVNSAERSEYNRRTSGIDRQIQAAEKNANDYKAIIAQPATDSQSQQTKTFAENALKAAEDEVNKLEGQKQTIEQEIVKRRPQTAPAATSAPVQQPATPQQQAPTSKPPAHNPEGVKNKQGQYYQYVAKGKSGQRVGSDDGKTWVDIKTGQPLR